MAGKMFNRRLLRSVAFEPGQEITVDLQGSRNVLHQVFIRIRGDITLSASGVEMKAGGMANLLENVRMLFSGFDPSVDKRYNSQDRLNMPGRYLALTKQVVNLGDSSLMTKRVNILNLHSALSEGYYKDIEATSLAKQPFKIPMEIPLYLPGGFSPRDMHLDMANSLFTQLVIRMGKLEDCFTSDDVAGDISNCVFDIEVVELEQQDVLPYRGSSEYPQAYTRATLQRLTVDADNDNLRRPIQLGASLLGIVFACYDNDGDVQDSMIEGIRLEREGSSFYDLSADSVREENIRDYPAFDNGLHPNSLKGSGLYIASPAADPNPLQLMQVPYLGAGNNQSEYILKVKKPDESPGYIDIILLECVMSDAFAATTYREQDKTSAQKSLGQPARNAAIARSKQIQDAAQALGGANG